MAQVIHSVNGMMNNETEMKGMDANRYATKKTIAQGMLDIALLTANASQLKYILQVGEQHQFYKLMLILISLSIVLQLMVGIFFVIIGSLNINRKQDQTAAIILNDIILVVIFVISICAGLLLMIQSLVSIHKGKTERKVADVLNHVINGFIFLSVFVDVIKMNFGLDPAVADVDNDVEILKN
ncbi:Ninjurin-2 [Lucilia cuprina]|nr:Ninjurin-2 [Lucilia cuprina]